MDETTRMEPAGRRRRSTTVAALIVSWLAACWAMYWVGLAGFSPFIILMLIPVVISVFAIPTALVLAMAWLLRKPISSVAIHLFVVLMVLGPGVLLGFRTMLSLEGWLAQRQLDQVALAIEDYQTTHGELPATIDALVPDFLDRLPRYPDFRFPRGVPIYFERESGELFAGRGWYFCSAHPDYQHGWTCDD